VQDQDTRRRRRTAVAIAVWSLLPASLAFAKAAHGDWLTATGPAVVAVGALAAASLARSSNRTRHHAAVAVLLALSIPFTLRLGRALLFIGDDMAARIADSPLGYLIGCVATSLFVVPLLAFAAAVWRRRAAV
jgi:hypothetical protein